MDKIYQDLTGVNIEEQKLLWDERGKGYYGEYLVFRELYRRVPGAAKLLMNLQIPVFGGKTTEIDLLMIHETGLYVFEVKHFKGTIYGKPTEPYWTQYFRTAPNQKFHNPVNQNCYHVNAIRKKYPGIPVHSFIVFTNDYCDLKVEGSALDTSICTLDSMLHQFSKVLRDQSPLFTLSQIDQIFMELKEFSPIMNEAVSINGDVIPFFQYLDILKNDFQNAITRNKRDAKRTKRRAISLSILFCFLVFFACGGIVSNARTELSAFAQKFERVEEFNYGDIHFSQDLVSVEDVVLAESPVFDNALDFSCLLKWTGKDCGACIGKDAKIIAILQDGTVQECDLWNETYPFYSTYYLGERNMWYGHLEGPIPVHRFYDVAISDISYIKLSNLGVFQLVDGKAVDLPVEYEIELFRK